MKRKSAWLSFAACALMGAHPVKAAVAKTSAVETPKVQPSAAFPGVQMVTFRENNNVGFFDNATGTVYIYDPAVTKCVAIKKLNALGEPTREIT